MARGTKAKEAAPPTPYHHGDLRQALVQAAVELLEHEGLSALSLRAAARRAGVSHAAPYHHFADKEALRAAVSAAGFRMQMEAMSEAVRNPPPPLEGLHAYGIRYITWASEHPSLFRLMYSHERATGSASPELVEASSAIYPQLLQGIQGRTGCSDAQAHTIALTLWSSVHGMAMLWLDGQLQWPGAPPLETLAFQVTDLLGLVMPRRPAPQQPR